MNPPSPKSLVETAPTVTLVLRGDIAELSPNRRFIAAQRRRIKNEWKDRALLEWMSLACPWFPGKVRVSFIAYRGRELDHCQLHGSGVLKAAIDGLKGKCFTDDSPRWLEWGTVQQVTGKEHRQCPTLLMRIEAVSGQD